MQEIRFNTATFSGRTAVINPLVMDLTCREHFLHFHAVTYEGCLGMPYWAGQAIEESGNHVLYVGKDGNSEYFSRDKSPIDINGHVVSITPHEAFVVLGRLPVRYDSMQDAKHGGLQTSIDFMRPYEELKRKLNREVRGERRMIQGLSDVIDDPSIFTGAHLSGMLAGKPAWKGVFHYGIKRLGLWHDSFDKLNYNASSSNIANPPNVSRGIEYPDDFDFERYAQIMLEFGGWIDYMPGWKNTDRVGGQSMTCNFTTCAKNGSDQVAIVQMAHGPSFDVMMPSQRKFAERIYEAFGVEPLAAQV